MNPSGNTILITGGASGIGLALARELLAAGNTVIVCGRDEAKLARARGELPKLATIRADVADANDRAALAAHLRGEFPKLNVLVNNAGVLHLSDLTAPSHVAELEEEIGVNLLGPVALTAELLPLLRSNANPTIANVTTGFIYIPGVYNAPYSATKSALHVMTLSLRYQLRGTNVRVVEIVPPVVDTAMTTHYDGPKATAESAAKAIAAGLRSRRNEIVVGASNVARVLARVAPGLGFAMINSAKPKTANAI